MAPPCTIPTPMPCWHALVTGGLPSASVRRCLRASTPEVENVRAALALVARGDAPLGVVYGSDALADPKVTVLWHIPDDQHPPITYPAVALSPEGAQFMDILRSPQAAEIFKQYGFGLP